MKFFRVEFIDVLPAQVAIRYYDCSVTDIPCLTVSTSTSGTSGTVAAYVAISGNEMPLFLVMGHIRLLT